MQCRNVNVQPLHQLRRGPAFGDPVSFRIATRLRVAENFNRSADPIDDPHLRHAKSGIEREPGSAIVGEGCVGDLDQEQYVGSGEMSRAIEVGMCVAA